MIKIDARGCACPEPVLMTKKAMTGSSEEFQVLVDNKTAVENIKRLISHSSRTFEVSEDGEDYVITIG